jgi:hypothetical protein
MNHISDYKFFIQQSFELKTADGFAQSFSPKKKLTDVIIRVVWCFNCLFCNKNPRKNPKNAIFLFNQKDMTLSNN